MSRLLGGIEAGGTKFVCALGRGPAELLAEARFPTTTPGETIARAIEFFRQAAGDEMPAAVGIGSFGPIDADPESPTFGHITSTPKPGWAHTDLAGAVARALDVPVGFDTDVNAAALAEHRWGAARGLDTFAYLTVGTGIGGGAMVGGHLVHGLVHPEMGHLLIARREDDDFPGVCPFHGGCLEGMASGPALEKRWGHAAEMLPDDHPAWDLEAHYLALGLANIVCVLSPSGSFSAAGSWLADSCSRPSGSSCVRTSPVTCRHRRSPRTTRRSSCRRVWGIARACWAPSPWPRSPRCPEE